MPQNPIAVSTSLNPRPRSTLVTAATVLKASPGNLLGIQVLVPGNAIGTVSDCATTGAVAAGNLVAEAPNAVGPVGVGSVGIPCATGITVTPGAGQTLRVTWN